MLSDPNGANVSAIDGGYMADVPGTGEPTITAKEQQTLTVFAVVKSAESIPKSKTDN